MSKLKGIILQFVNEEGDIQYLKDLIENGELNTIFLRSSRIPFAFTPHIANESVKIFRYINEGDLFSEIFASRSDATEYAKDCVETCAKDGFHGLLFDWSAPGFNHTKREDSDRAISDPINYLAFLRDLRTRMKANPRTEKTEVAICIPAAQPHLRRISIVIEDMKRVVNYFVLADWDMHATSVTAVHASKLYGRNLCAESAVTAYNRIGLSNDRMALGIPLYGVYFTDCEALGERYTNATPASPDMMELVRTLPEKLIQRDSLSGNLPLYNDTVSRKLYTFEDRTSFSTKQEFVQQNGMLGWVGIARDAFVSDRTMLPVFSASAPLHSILAEPIPERRDSKLVTPPPPLLVSHTLPAEIPSPGPQKPKEPNEQQQEPKDTETEEAEKVNEDFDVVFSILQMAAERNDAPNAPRPSPPEPVVQRPPVEVKVETEVSEPVSPPPPVPARRAFPKLRTSTRSEDTKRKKSDIKAGADVQWTPWADWETYVAGDIVRYGKSLFICTVSHRPVSPLSNPETWHALGSSFVNDKDISQIQEKVGENHDNEEHLETEQTRQKEGESFHRFP